MADGKDKKTNEMDDLASEKPRSIVREFFDFLLDNKKWWMIPILIFIVLLGAFVLLSGTAAAPFIYTLF
ncbi:MAG: DUF5989 family protein [Candidatus Sumerlaeota bacterium]